MSGPRHRILLDLDGVFADLQSRVFDVHGLDPSKLKPGEWFISKSYPHLTEEQMWSHPELQTRNFWRLLPKTPWADDLMRVVTNFFPAEDQCFLTKPLPTAPLCAAGKMDWLREHYPDRRFLIGDGKCFTGSSFNVLLDDADRNIAEFEEHLGTGVLFPRPWNRMHYMPDPVSYVYGRLERIRRGGL